MLITFSNNKQAMQSNTVDPAIWDLQQKNTSEAEESSVIFCSGSEIEQSSANETSWSDEKFSTFGNLPSNQ